MAKTAAKKASNFFMWIIMALLIVGLAGFGVSNFGGTIRAVAAVGQTEVSIDTYARALQNELNAISQAQGQPVSFAQGQALGVDGRVLQALLANAALDEAARIAGLSVGDEAVSAQILQIPAFAGVNGGFDRESYRFMLDRNGMTVSEFEEQIRAELSRNLLQVALTNGIAPGPAFGDAVYRFLSEGRRLSVAPVTADILEAPLPEPTEEEIAAFYEANPDLFTLPERKSITYAWLTPEMLAETLEIDEAALRAAYDDRIEEFRRPERRMVDRLGFADAAAADAAAAAIAAGETDFAALLEERGLSEDDVDLGIVDAASLGAAGEGVFALEDTGVAGPLPSPTGPALYRVNAILSASETGFDEAREGLREELALERAEGVIDDEVEALDDLLAGGATLEELAQESDLELGTLEWTGAERDGPGGYAAFAEAADAVTTADFPEIAALEDGGIFALRLNEVVPSNLQPLAEVRDEAARLTAEAARNAALAERAEVLLPQLAEGAGFDSVGLSAVVHDNVSRRSVPPELSTEVFEAGFRMAPGEVRLVETPDGPVVVRMEAIVPPPADDPAAEAVRNSVTQEAAAGMAGDVLAAVVRSVEASSGITTNPAALNAVHTQLP